MAHKKKKHHRHTPNRNNLKRRMNGRKKNQSLTMTAVLIFLTIFTFFMVNMIRFFIKEKIEIMQVEYYQADTNAKHEAVIIRDEEVIFAEEATDYETVFHVKNHEKIQKNKLILSLKEKENYEELETKIKDLDKEIMKEQFKRSDLIVYQDEIKQINKSISKTLYEEIENFKRGNFKNLHRTTQHVHQLMDERNGYLLTEKKGTPADTMEQRAMYHERLKNSIKEYYSDKSALVSFDVDGFESVYHPKNMRNLTKSEIVSLGKNDEKKDGLYKLVNTNYWYLASYFSQEEMENKKINHYLSVYPLNEAENIKLQAKIIHLEESDKEYFVILELHQHLENFLDKRMLEFVLGDEKTEGFFIPSSAVVEKTAITIPRSYIQQEAITLKKGNETQSIPVDGILLGRDLENVYTIDPRLKLGSEIVHADGTIYTLTEVKNFSGVYVVNSSIARFKTIGNVLYQTSAYMITEMHTGELKLYDRIVKDAQHITQDQLIDG